MPQKTAKAPAPEKKTAAEPVAKKIIAAKVEKPAVKMPLPPKAAPPPAPAPVVKAEVKPEAAPEEKQQAALPPGPETTKTGQTLRVEFAANVSKLPATAKTGLLALAAKLKDNENLRLQLMAYAGGKSLSASNARRLSLSRALSVRSFLIEKGVRSTRIDVRALGNKTTETPPNRVDVNIVER
ncbi:MAG: OmpA family protein [Rhodospirillales bacterium]|nr:OmpA family protein [Rhodospirillales bacterium]